jgi:transcriptional regulator with XRE-family HTH domain
MDPKDLGRRVREARIRKNMAQDDLAAAVGVRGLAISRLELGKVADPKTSTLSAIAETLEVPLDWLLNGERESRIEPMDDVELPVAERALRAMGQDAATTQRLRERLARVQFSTGARLSTIVSWLEDALVELRAEDRAGGPPADGDGETGLRQARGPQPVEVKPREGGMQRPRSPKKGR